MKMILDGGFWSEECLLSLHSICEAFTVGMPIHLKISENILKTYGRGIEKYENELIRHHIYCIPVNTEIYGVSGRVLLYYDSWTHLNQCVELSNHIDKLQAELKTLKRYPKSKLRRYSPYFVLTKHNHDSGFDYTIDADMKSTASDILDYYCAKDVDEKLFSQIKVDMDGSRIRTHNEKTAGGKTLVTFIAYVIQSYLLNKLTN